MKIKKRYYEIDFESEIVYYTEEGFEGIKTMKSIEEYQQMVDNEKRIATSYFEFHTDSIGYCKVQIVKHKVIMRMLEDIKDIEERTQIMMRYFKEKEAMGL